MNLPRSSFALLLGAALAVHAQTLSTWDAGGVTQNWSEGLNWNPDGPPCNSNSESFLAQINAGAGTVIVDINCTVDILGLQAGTGLQIEPDITLEVTDRVANDGQITVKGGPDFSDFEVSDVFGDTMVELEGTGRLVLEADNASIGGQIDHTLVHDGAHSIEGFGNLGRNRINFVNRGGISADVAGETLVLEPRDSFDHAGVLNAKDGGILRLEAATYTVDPGSSMIIHDGSEMQLTGVTMQGGTFRKSNLDGDLSNNRVVVVGGTTWSGAMKNEATLAIATGQRLTLDEDDLLNDGVIALEGTSNTSLFLENSGDMEMVISGQGKIVLDGPNDSLTGDADVTLIQESLHRIEGGGKLGNGLLNFINKGTVVANDPATRLEIDPRGTWVNQGGTVAARDGGSVVLFDGEYSKVGSGGYEIGDGSEILLNGAVVSGGDFLADDQNADISDNLVTISGGSTSSDLTSTAKVVVERGHDLNVSGGNFVDNGVVELQGSGITSRLFIRDDDDQEVTISGSGVVLLDDPRDEIAGTSNHRLIHENGHLIVGEGVVGGNTINITNRGTIRADRSGAILEVEPAGEFLNDGGLVEVLNGAVLQLFGGIFSATPGGSYRVGDGSRIELSSATLDSMTLEIDDQDASIDNNKVVVTGATTFTDVVNNGRLELNNGQLLTVSEGSLTNNGVIELKSTGNTTTILVTDLGAGVPLELNGTGRLLLDGPDRVGGRNGQVLVHGADHAVEGAGFFGGNQLNITHRGLLSANLSGETLELEPGSSFMNDGGRVRAENGGILLFSRGTFEAVNGGEYKIFDNSPFQLSQATMKNLTLAVADGDLNLQTNVVEVVGLSELQDVVNEATLRVNDGQVLRVTAGNLTNNGVVELASTGSFTTFGFNAPGSATQELNGTGRLILDDERELVNGLNGVPLIHGPDHTIEGFGALGANLLHLTNRGTISANVAGQTLLINDDENAGMENESTVQAIGGGVLEFQDGVRQKAGLLLVDAASSADLLGTLDQTGGTTRVNGILGANSVALSGGILEGTGTVEAPVTATSTGTVSPGNSVGTLEIDGGATFNDGSVLRIEIASAASADLLEVTGGGVVVSLATLRLDYSGGEGDILPEDQITILTTSGGGVSGEFANAPDGRRLATSNGNANFVVTYQPSAIVLSGFSTDPISRTNQEVVTDVLTEPGGPYEGETDLAIIGIGADPDGDRDENIFELWQGADPASAGSQPAGAVLKVVDNGGTDFGAFEIEVDSAMDDALVIDVDLSFDLVNWRDIGETRAVLSDAGGVRRLEFTDLVPLPGPLAEFFVRFTADPNESP